MAKKIRSVEGPFGTITHYDEKGKKIGTSHVGRFKTDHYDEKGRRVGSSYSGASKSDHYLNNKYAGSSSKGGLFSDYYDAKGNAKGKSMDTPRGEKYSWFDD